MKKILYKAADSLTTAEWVFHYKMFLEYINCKMYRQGAFKILSNLNKLYVYDKLKFL